MNRGRTSKGGCRRTAFWLRDAPFHPKKGAGPETGPIFLRSAAEAAEPFLPAGAGAEGDFHAPVLRLADAVGGLDQRPALAERFGRDHAVRNAVTGKVGARFTWENNVAQTGSKLGMMFLSVLGDVDGDGVPDVYASDWSNTAKGQSTGRVYVYSGKSGKPLFALTGETEGEGFGTTQSIAGDVDGDGHADLIVGSWQYAGAAISGGRAYLYSGKDAHLIRTYTCKTPGDTFGFDAVALGDVDRDGTADFLITSGWSSVHGFQSGRVLLISSGVRRSKH